MNFFDKLATLCKLRNITIDNLLHKIGRTSNTYYSWRARNLLPRCDELYEICKILNVPMEYFFSADDNVIPPAMKSLVQKIELLSVDEFEILNNMTEDQLRSMIALCKSIKN